MKSIWLCLLVALLVTGLIYQLTIFQYQVNARSPVSTPTPTGASTTLASNVTASPDVFLGVTFGGNTIAQAKLLIDKVKGYTNLFVVDSWAIGGAPNATALTEVCDYAVNANLYVIVYFSFIYYNYTAQLGNRYNASSWDLYGYIPWHIPWLNNAREKWGDKFLGVYLYDEPGGKIIDTGYWNGNKTTLSGAKVTSFENLTDYNDAANRYTTARQSILNSSSMQHLINSSLPNSINSPMPVFTSDYALYWFDYLTGYSAVFVELGGTSGIGSKVQQTAQCRGAANVQGKQWGAIITWTYNDPPYMENGTEMLKDMNMAYGAGAKYIIAFDYPYLPDNPYGVLTEDHFNAMQTFWNEIQNTSRSKLGEVYGTIAYVLPKNYGWGMRTPTDNIWGHWPADNQSTLIWNNMMKLLNQYGPKLDVIYDDSNFNYQQDYSTIYYWNSTTIALATSTGTSTLSSGTTDLSPTYIIALVATVAIVSIIPMTLVYTRWGKQETTLLEEEHPIYNPKLPPPKKSTTAAPYRQPEKYSRQFSIKPTGTIRYNPPRSYSQQLPKMPTVVTKYNQPTSYSQQSYATKICRHCKQTVREDLNVCPQCLKRLK